MLGKKKLDSDANQLHGSIPDVDVKHTELATRMIVVLGLLVALGPLTIDMYLPALPKIADDLSVSSSVVAADADRHAGGAGAGSADRRSAVGFARAGAGR